MNDKKRQREEVDIEAIVKEAVKVALTKHNTGGQSIEKTEPEPKKLIKEATPEELIKIFNKILSDIISEKGFTSSDESYGLRKFTACMQNPNLMTNQYLEKLCAVDGYVDLETTYKGDKECELVIYYTKDLKAKIRWQELSTHEATTMREKRKTIDEKTDQHRFINSLAVYIDLQEDKKPEVLTRSDVNRMTVVQLTFLVKSTIKTNQLLKFVADHQLKILSFRWGAHSIENSLCIIFEIHSIPQS